ncbi:retrovirus-related pol polyprotein from transposon RE2 [Citrus sinensis]|uniref:Retrovirus-related pol polyprotein from transposon RE2 n=1 Tax=Citrus sinensis TaxID=2711 RepID=A0ACB8NUQ7_CITSI|nr:retrovirus-related pol polyprotein from transposon RE2 [Citrus sinensis]
MMMEDVLTLVVGGQTVKEVWLSIEENMLPATKERESWLKDNLFSLKKGSLKLDDFLNKFRGLCDSLAAIGKPLTDDDKVFQLARALGPKYADFKMAMLTKPPYPSLKLFLSALQNHKQTVIAQKNDGKEADPQQAFFGQRGRGKKHTDQRKHNSKSGIICQICGKTNHSAAVCRHRYDYFTPEEEAPQALAAMNLQDENDPQLYADSGATAHMENQVLAQGTRHGDLYVLNEGGNLAFQTIKRNSENQDLWHKRLGHPSPKILQCFLKFQKQVENQMERKIKIFQSDGGGEFSSIIFQQHLQQSGIIKQTSCPYTPQQNGVAERKHRHIMETALTMLFESSLPLKYWVEAVLTAVYLINKLPQTIIKMHTPHELLFKETPSYNEIKDACSVPTIPNVSQWLPTTWTESFNNTSLGHTKVANPNYTATSPNTNEPLFPTPNKVVIIEDLHEQSTYLPESPSPNSHQKSPSSNNKTVASADNTHIHMTSEQTLDSDNRAPSALNDLSGKLFVELNISPVKTTESLNTHPMLTRNKLKQNPTLALQIDHATVTEPKTLKSALKHPLWLQAMAEELAALHQNKTWTLVPRPHDANVIGSKWVYKTKYREDGTIDRLKARLVAKGYTQVPSIDFDETFSPVIKPTTIRLVLALAISSKWLIKQLDVRNAFLHGQLKEIAYMEQPLGFTDQNLPDHIRRFPGGIFLSQAKYTRDLLTKAALLDCTPNRTPMAVKTQLYDDDQEPIHATHYRSLVGSLQYLTFTRPDITHAVNKKQSTVARSTAEAEYRALSSTTAELTWILSLLQDIGVSPSHIPHLFCDNTSAIYMTRNPVFHARSKHIKIDVHFVREKVSQGLLKATHVPSLQQAADILTKPLGKDLFFLFQHKLGVHSMTRPTLRGAVKIHCPPNVEFEQSQHMNHMQPHESRTNMEKISTPTQSHINKASCKPLETNMAICIALAKGLQQSSHTIP